MDNGSVISIYGRISRWVSNMLASFRYTGCGFVGRDDPAQKGELAGQVLPSRFFTYDDIEGLWTEVSGDRL